MQKGHSQAAALQCGPMSKLIPGLAGVLQSAADALSAARNSLSDGGLERLWDGRFNVSHTFTIPASAACNACQLQHAYSNNADGCELGKSG